MKELTFVHNKAPKKCCSKIDNLEPILLYFDGTCAFTHFCTNCGWLGLEQITSPAELQGDVEAIEEIVSGRIEYVTYPFADYKKTKDMLGKLDVATKKIIIPFKNAKKETSEEGSIDQ